MVKSKLNPKNENTRDKYIKFLDKNKKLSSETIASKIVVLKLYNECFDNEDYADFDLDNSYKIYDFLKNLSKQNKFSISTMIEHLNNLRNFFEWFIVFCRPTNKNIMYLGIDNLQPSNADKAAANREKIRPYPTLEEYKSLMNMEIKNVIDQRDNALLAFLFVSCARAGAIITSKIGLVDIVNKKFKQTPEDGVHTKRGKYIQTQLMKFDESYFNIIENWINTLITEYNFTDEEPLFPVIKKSNSGKFVVTKGHLTIAQCNSMIEERCKQLGFKEKYTCHEFRHFGIFQALDRVKTGKQLKALSQNVGHESIVTILTQYANMEEPIYTEIIKNMFENNIDSKTIGEATTSELLQELLRRNQIEKAF